MVPSNHWDKTGNCSCPKIYPCAECGKFCTDHDLMCDIYICKECFSKSWKELQASLEAFKPPTIS